MSPKLIQCLSIKKHAQFFLLQAIQFRLKEITFICITSRLQTMPPGGGINGKKCSGPSTQPWGTSFHQLIQI